MTPPLPPGAIPDNEMTPANLPPASRRIMDIIISAIDGPGGSSFSTLSAQLGMSKSTLADQVRGRSLIPLRVADAVLTILNHRLTVEPGERQPCSVPQCANFAKYEVIHFDCSLTTPDKVFFQRDQTCCFICTQHQVENEAKAVGQRAPGGDMTYPHTNKSRMRGYSIYKPLTR